MKNERILWHGEMTTANALRRRGSSFLSSGTFWLLAFLILPSLIFIALSFAERGVYGEVIWRFTLENYKRLLGFSTFGWTPDYLLILGRSVVVAGVTTLIAVLLSYPLTFYIASRPKRTRFIWLTILIVPFWTNMVIRTYAWILLMSPELPFAKLAAFLKLIPDGTSLYPGAFAVYVGMITTYLPFLALPLYASVERMDWTLVEAAQDLYASKFKIFTQAILPQTAPGLTVGIILTLVPAMATFVVPDLLGGAKYMLVGNLIQQQFSTSRDWPFGAAISMALMLLTLLSMRLYRRKGTKVDIA
ncbi:ABC transporter permease [Geovibrio thiophilus]|uniref:ABC transporter permease n=1 Tax=Geovibrio thiophilus TaxID=139438 RepID=A0A410JXB2_9BACT|nr:ABC transporter permease [Geovibrio thiophilus]QAR32651.1 ABC transporter permease [Geovibrio thiophilus]